jgi:phosphoglycolate phosphatase-like HAD superfamily hydrolase
MFRSIGKGVVFIFDVEGTLIDSVSMTITCWLEILEGFDLPACRDDLQRLSGMDGDAMLQNLFPKLEERQRKELATAEGERYRSVYLPSAAPFPGIRALFEALKESGAAVALATDCQQDELRHYRRLMKVDGLIDAIACGTEVPHGKPHPALLMNVLAQLGSAPTARAIMVGDTPFDARAARSIGAGAIGLLTGGHSRTTLVSSGCSLVASSLAELRAVLVQQTSGDGGFTPWAGTAR